ncbi:hypothetical protein KY290_023472 [Solanum tuberosum]|uniref:Uncharacterized protein n=3 Tax=Solanum tuberosum TaxID=4113 RepID=A0ABQ7V782_SOLTU|nr:hypothetical protein KY289_021116 [Solanum tuberosum]KAH0759979.1 hypothetical protein KY290_023472 [Solanum tuberosum]
MGSCISKCNPQKNPQEDDDQHHECVKDKLVISQAPVSPKIHVPSSTIQPPRKLVSSSPSSSSCSVSLSSFSSTATNVTLSSSLSSSSSSSSSSYFKDRSFSNDFLLSCAQEHDHILDIKKNKVSHQNTSTMSTSAKKYSRSPSSSSTTLSKPPSPQRECNSTTTPKKRPRANSPIMVRQKSFRKEHDQQLMIKGSNIGNNHTSSITSTYHHFPSTRTTLKSPSPSRRFPSNSNGDMKENSFRKSIASKGNNGSVISRSSSLRRENHFTPKNDGKMRNVFPISPKIDEMEIGEEVKSNDQDLDSFLMEDINNPLIALDCFIFL